MMIFVGGKEWMDVALNVDVKMSNYLLKSHYSSLVALCVHHYMAFSLEFVK